MIVGSARREVAKAINAIEDMQPDASDENAEAMEGVRAGLVALLETNEKRPRITVLVKRPVREWEHPAEAYEDEGDAEEQMAALGVDLDLVEVGRIVRDVPLVPSGGVRELEAQ